MANNRNPKQKQPGEKGSGKYHYNPGNQSGKTVEIIKPEPAHENNADRIERRQEQKDRERR
jgi:hypothetical protein